MPHATLLLRPQVAYRRECFEAGLTAAGFEVSASAPRVIARDDLLVLWNRKPIEEAVARRYENAHARVLVVENGYIGRAPDGGKLYAMALGHHNGAGRWPCGGPERLEGQGVELAPWRERGLQIVVLAQRGIGEKGVAMPGRWAGEIMQRLQRSTSRPVQLRRHPGSIKAEPYDDLDGAHAAVTWASGAAIKALAAGVPVFYELRSWIGAGAACLLETADLEHPKTADAARLAMFQRLAWAQWSLSEVASGEAFAWLLRL